MYAGLDLAAKEKNYSGICILNKNGKIIFIGLVKKDKEIKKFLKFVKIIAIDAPLTKSKKDRKTEKLLRKKGLKPLSLKLKSMQALAKRALKLKNYFNKNKIIVIETFPSAIKIKKFKNKHINDAFKAALVALAYEKNKSKKIGNIYLL
ncbi:MAG: hypothetical protein QXQ30_02615 [Candidatus Pacearchaeota archaeon]